MYTNDFPDAAQETEYLAVTPWGDFYPCHQFVGEEQYLMGNVDEGITKPEIVKRLWKM